MILSRISTYLRERRRASVSDLAHAFDSTPEALGPMLETLERKGRVRRIGAASGCGTSCCKCDAETLAVYEWTGAGAAGAADGPAARPGA
jgi:DNA-binding Lrp family transcriptional regulator